jgi:hypothetical protein
MISRVVDLFWSRIEAPDRGLYLRLDGSYTAVRTLTRCYYAGLLLIAIQHLTLWDHYVGLRAIQPLWPVLWANPESGRAAMIVLLLFVSGSLLAALFPGRLLARSLAFAGCLEFVAFVNSFGAIRHVYHLLLLTTFLLLFLPGGQRDDDGAKRAYLRAFWGVQCGALLPYSMSGVIKIATGLCQLAGGKGGVLTPPAFALHVANAAFYFGVEPSLADLALRSRSLGLPLYLAMIYLETCAFPIAFRPRLHRTWGAALILMHLGTGLTLNIFFLPSMLVIGILLLASPFAPESPDWRRTARALPLLGRLLPRRG